MGILIDDYAHGKNSTPLPNTLSALNWNSKIKDILPGEWELQDSWASEKADIRDVLSHVSGMPRHDGSYGPHDSITDVIRRMKFLRPAYELRQKFSYNNQMYMLGAHILTKYTGSYIDYAEQRIFKPLGMNATTFSPREAHQSKKLTHTWTGHGQRIPYWIPEESKHLNAGPGGIITNVVDLSKWLKALLNSGVDSAANKTVIPKSAFEAVTTSSAITEGKAPSSGFSIGGYGMGWFRSSYQGREVISHSGAIPGLTSHVSFYPEANIGIAVLLNTGDKNQVAVALSYRVVEDILGLPYVFQAGDPPPPVAPPPRSPNTSTPAPLSAYAGTYRNPGYGAFTLCEPTAMSSYCAGVLAAFRAVDGAQSPPRAPPLDVPQLLGAWARVWASHVRLVHVERSAFATAFTALFPRGYGASRRPFETYELDRYEGRAEFVVDEARGAVKGFGFFGADAMAGTRGEDVSIEEGAMVWFEKV
ncbi:beta-lactamase/transpeptidase-like protein [Phellopilus nigrolimitatus]|nr:beta-lactamase/transpeptidase-like protein [Phellopilus nigrolimitatus]